MQPYYVLSWILRNLHSDTDFDRNRRSEKLPKLGGSQKVLFLGGRGCPMRGRPKNFHFQEAVAQ